MTFTQKRLLALSVLCFLFFFLGNNILALTDPDEVFYSLITKEMAAQNSWQVPFIFGQPNFEKPIFTFWLLRIAHELGGLEPWVLRFFPALFGSLGVFAVYGLGLLGFRNERKAFWSAVAMATSALYVGMGKTVFTDMFFTVLILYALLSFYWAYANPIRKELGFLGFYVFSALAVLAKGPLGLTITEGTVILFLLYQRQIRFILNPWMLIGLLICISIALPWYVYMYQTYGQAFIHEFFYNDHWRRLIEAEHKGNDRWYFYPLTMFMGVFPWSLLLLIALKRLYGRLKAKTYPFDYFLLSWILVVIVIFQPAHSKLASYIMPLFPALALLIGSYAEEGINSSAKALKVSAFLVSGFLALLGIGVFVAYPLFHKYVPNKLPLFFCSGVLITVASVAVSLVLREKMAAALMALAFSPLAFLATAYVVKPDIQPYVSSYEVSQYLPHYPAKSTLLAAKPYARGLRFFTGQEVAVLNLGGQNYFSPHPVPILNTMDKVTDFLRQQKITYAVIKKNAYKALSELPADQFQTQVLKTVGYNYVLRIEFLKKP